MAKKTTSASTTKKKMTTTKLPPTKPASASTPVKRANRSKKPQLLRGMRDILPSEQPYIDYVMEAVAQTSRAYNFKRIDVPVVEELNLFVRTIGEGTDVVDKEMYTFTTQGDDVVALRPEFTAGIARAYVEHGMVNLPQPVKLWTSGPLFRYDRPQAGRYRQFWQANWEIMGNDKPALDAELISLATHILRGLGLDVTVLVNSLGSRESRKDYVNALRDYLKPFKDQLDEDSQIRLKKNPLRILDSKEPATQALLADAPQLVDFLDDESREHFMQVLEYLDESDIPYRLQPYLVRGLDYYCKTTFEVVLTSQADQPSPSALLGGGRYDYLLEELGAPGPTPAIGMAMGIDRVVLAIKEAGIDIGQEPAPDLFLVQIGETARKRALRLFEELRQEGFAIISNISKNKLSDQLSLAHKSAARIALILGQKEMIDNTIIVRDMQNGSQENIPQDKLIEYLKKQLKKK